MSAETFTAKLPEIVAHAEKGLMALYNSFQDSSELTRAFPTLDECRLIMKSDVDAAILFAHCEKDKTGFVKEGRGRDEWLGKIARFEVGGEFLKANVVFLTTENGRSILLPSRDFDAAKKLDALRQGLPLFRGTAFTKNGSDISIRSYHAFLNNRWIMIPSIGGALKEIEDKEN